MTLKSFACLLIELTAAIQQVDLVENQSAHVYLKAGESFEVQLDDTARKGFRWINSHQYTTRETRNVSYDKEKQISTNIERASPYEIEWEGKLIFGGEEGDVEFEAEITMGTLESTEFEIDTNTIIGGKHSIVEQEFEVVVGQSDPAFFEAEYEWALGTQRDTPKFDLETIIDGTVAAIEQELEVVIPDIFEGEFEWALGGKPNDNATGSETDSETSGSEEETVHYTATKTEDALQAKAISDAIIAEVRSRSIAL